MMQTVIYDKQHNHMIQIQNGRCAVQMDCQLLSFISRSSKVEAKLCGQHPRVVNKVLKNFPHYIKLS